METPRTSRSEVVCYEVVHNSLRHGGVTGERLDVDQVPRPLQPAGRLVVGVEENQALQELVPPLPESDEDVGPQAGPDTDTGGNAAGVASVIR